MPRSPIHPLTFLLFLAILFVASPLASAQVGPITQEVSKIAAYGLQKACARKCFQDEAGNFCPNDLLGSKIGCAPHTDCNTFSWLATNDCYCRPDLQSIAQAHLTSCVKRACSVGDLAIDASSAGSIYSQYCKEKGYVAALPATVSATLTGSGRATTAPSATGAGSAPTETSGSSSSAGSSSNSNSLSITTIVGIVVGGIAGLAMLTYVLKRLGACFSHRKQQLPPYQLPLVDQKPMFPAVMHHESYYSSPGLGSEVGPDDSVSVFGGPTRPAPTLVSGVGYSQNRW